MLTHDNYNEISTQQPIEAIHEIQSPTSLLCYVIVLLVLVIVVHKIDQSISTALLRYHTPFIYARLCYICGKQGGRGWRWLFSIFRLIWCKFSE